MPHRVITEFENAAHIIAECKMNGIVPFIFNYIDIDHTLVKDKFLYVNSMEELEEKVALLKADFTLVDQLRI